MWNQKIHSVSWSCLNMSHNSKPQDHVVVSYTQRLAAWTHKILESASPKLTSETRIDVLLGSCGTLKVLKLQHELTTRVTVGSQIVKRSKFNCI